jgi:hypothetical protein
MYICATWPCRSRTLSFLQTKTTSIVRDGTKHQALCGQSDWRIRTRATASNNNGECHDCFSCDVVSLFRFCEHGTEQSAHVRVNNIDHRRCSQVNSESNSFESLVCSIIRFTMEFFFVPVVVLADR